MHGKPASMPVIAGQRWHSLLHSIAPCLPAAITCHPAMSAVAPYETTATNHALPDALLGRVLALAGREAG